MRGCAAPEILVAAKFSRASATNASAGPHDLRWRHVAARLGGSCRTCNPPLIPLRAAVADMADRFRPQAQFFDLIRANRSAAAVGTTLNRRREDHEHSPPRLATRPCRPQRRPAQPARRHSHRIARKRTPELYDLHATRNNSGALPARSSATSTMPSSLLLLERPISMRIPTMGGWHES